MQVMRRRPKRMEIWVQLRGSVPEQENFVLKHPGKAVLGWDPMTNQSYVFDAVKLANDGCFSFVTLAQGMWLQKPPKQNLEDFRKEFQEQNPDVKSMREVGKACGEKWKTMTYEEKVKYYDIATEKRAEFDRAMSEYIRRELSTVYGSRGLLKKKVEEASVV
ncbi:hypothetical protein OIU77_006166 [Salix suchowensis]|uniref:HMG box domain-containing protein n=1 Tax=Salix suchowensis TaxID=1278906 RepID=A0ABQ9AJW2_9ROSI|nr:hypothetical protein OIU78_022699 [Salix suchowensis]KAJ6348537.1 hypothetical protein OIU77_006166 [Salix suchowensis]